jgi:sulfate adenylyltransferase
MPPPGQGRLTVLVARVPLTADIEWVRSRSHQLGCDVVWLVPVVNPTPDGIPPGVLLRSVNTAVAAVPGSQVVAVPLWWRGSSYDEPLGRAVARAWQATYSMTLTAAAGVSDSATAVTNGAPIVEPESQSAREAWRVLVGALDGVAPGTTPPAADRVAALVPNATAQQLLRWRPPRTERGLVVLLTGLSGSGKSTLARALAQQLEERYDRRTSLLDGDVVRALLSSGLGFDAASRDLNVRRIGFVAAEVARHGGIAVCAPIAPYQRSRDAVRTMAREVGDFLLVHVCTPIEECERRDLKGLYAKARAGQLEGFTGISDPYEEPADADLLIDTLRLGPQEALETLLKHLEQGGWVSGVPEGGAWTGH